MSCIVRGASREGLWSVCSGVWEMMWVVVDLGYEGVIYASLIQLPEGIV